ncbi:MAG: hypothetical protein QOE51_410, partial [Actinoplanes sp.]|nr:hypothetical protein [Actinoplanes sp.]
GPGRNTEQLFPWASPDYSHGHNWPRCGTEPNCGTILPKLTSFVVTINATALGETQRHTRRRRQTRDRLDRSHTPSTAGNPRPDRARHPTRPPGDGPPQPEQIDLTAPTPRPTRRDQPINTRPDQTDPSSPSPARAHETPVHPTEPSQPDPARQCQIDPRNTRQSRPVGQHHPQTAEIRHPQPVGRRHTAPSDTDRPVSTTSAGPDPPRRKHRYPSIANEIQPEHPAHINSPATVTLLRRQEQHNQRAPPRVHTKRPAAARTECRAGEQSPGSRTLANEDRRSDEWSVDARLRALIGY